VKPLELGVKSQITPTWFGLIALMCRIWRYGAVSRCAIPLSTVESTLATRLSFGIMFSVTSLRGEPLNATLKTRSTPNATNITMPRTVHALLPAWTVTLALPLPQTALTLLDSVAVQVPRHWREPFQFLHFSYVYLSRERVEHLFLGESYGGCSSLTH
jgi:hypothetical protein